MSNPARPLNEKLFSINSIISNYSSKIDKLINSTSGINTTFTSGTSNNCLSHTINKYLSQSADYLSRSATNSSITRSTNLFTLQAGLKNSTEELDTDYRHLPENKLISNSEKSENLHTFSPITPIVDQSDLFSDCSGDNNSNSDKLIYKSIMIIDVLNKMSTPEAAKENSVLNDECQVPSIKNVFRKSFNNFYLLNQLEGDYFSYDLVEREALEIDNRSSKSNSLKRKANMFKKTGKVTINYTRNFRKKIRENPFVVYNQNGRKLVKKLLNKSKNPDMALSPTDLDSLFATINHEYEYAFEYMNPRRKVAFNKKKKLPRKTVVKITKLCPSDKNSCDSEGSESSSEHPCSICTDNDYQNNMNNKNHIDLSSNEVDASAEFARADDDFEINGHVKSSDDEYTESYCDVLATIHEKEANETNFKENVVPTETNDEPEILDLIINRLPGEKLGLNLKVEEKGSVLVVSVNENSAADRASDIAGNRQSIQMNDELLEINGVSLNNMSNDDILCVVQELPLHVSLKLKRTSSLVAISPNETNSNNNAIESGQSSPNDSATKVPIGYSLFTIYLSSLETKCIMPSDLKESADADGLYKMQKSTLQIGEQDNLKKGDIIYCINGENMAYCNKFDLVSKLSNLNGIAEVSILRKSNCYGPHKDQVPYHNGIFAQNSIKLAMPKYDKPSIKSNSENDMHNNGINSSKTDIFSDEFRHSMYNIRSEMDNNDSQVFKATLVQCKDLEAELNNIQPESIANDNWLLYDKNSTEKILKSSTIDSRKFEKTENSVTHTFKDTDTANPVTNLSEPSLLFDHGTARSLTSSSCHSERSMIQLNAICIENDLVSKDDESESEVNAKSAKESNSFPDYSVIAPKNEPTQSDSNKYVSICQIEIKSSNTAQNKFANLKIVKPCRVTFDPDLSDCETVREKTEPIVHPKSTDLETLIEDNFPVEIKDMTENDCDLNSPRITSHSSDYCKLSTKGLNDTYHDNYEKFDQDFDNDAVKLVLDRIIEQIELINEEKDETLSDTSSFGLRETFEEFDDACRDIHPDETSDTILEEADLKDTNNCESAFECEEPRPEVINEHKTDELKDESTLSRLLKSDSDSSSSLLKHSTQIGLDDTQACLNTSIPPAPPLPEKMFSSISDVSAIQASYDICRTFEATQSLEESNLHLRESSLPNMSLENVYDKVRSPIKKMSKVSDRINSLITARPYSSLKNPITKQDKANNYCKALLAFKKQNSTFSKFFIVQTRALFNDQMVCNRSTCSFSKSASPKQEKKRNQTWNNFIEGVAQKNINLKSEKNRKDELVIDYVESACDKQIRQKSLNQNCLSSSNPAISNINLLVNGTANCIDSVNKNDSFTSVEKNDPKKIDDLKQICSVKEKIMLFTQNSDSKSKIDKTKIYEPKLSKSVLATSTPSINESIYLKSNVSISIPKNLNTSNTNSKQNLNDSKKFLSTSTLNKNFVSQPNISLIEKHSELVESIIIKDESIASIQKDEEDSLPKFKSVKDKIAYFSSKSCKSDTENHSPIVKKLNDSPKVSPHQKLPNKIEIIESNEMPSFDPVSEDYDSLKNAYRLNSIAHSTMAKNSLGKSCMNLKTCQKEFMREVKQRYSSTNLLNTYNSSKLELKNFIYSNENKISDLIENIEQKMKKN